MKLDLDVFTATVEHQIFWDWNRWAIITHNLCNFCFCTLQVFQHLPYQNSLIHNIGNYLAKEDVERLEVYTNRLQRLCVITIHLFQYQKIQCFTVALNTSRSSFIFVKNFNNQKKCCLIIVHLRINLVTFSPSHYPRKDLKQRIDVCHRNDK